MPVACLTIVVYAETGWNWHLEKMFNPTWDDIVTSIDRLDKFRYPWVWLFIGDETEDVTVDCLTIMGGDGVYWLGLSAGKYDSFDCSIRIKAVMRFSCGPAIRDLRMRRSM